MNRRADLHVHSKYSDRPSDWLLRRLGCPESFTEPLELYRICRDRGMDFVTITDHNDIQGGLEIAHLPGTFLSSEVTTYFPEDGCKVHLLVWGLDEASWSDIDAIRGSIYELRDYLYDREIAHAVAHPLFAVNQKLTVAHLEKLLVLFKRFEGINGSRDRRASEIFLALLAGLDAQRLGELAHRHRLEPRDERPWEKLLCAGSDDHGGLHIASASTVTPDAASVGDYLAHLRAGRHSMDGESGSSLKLAHSIYAIAHTFYRRRLGRGAGADELIGEIFRRFLDDVPESAGRLRRATRAVFGERRATKIDRRLGEGFTNLLELRATAPASTRERRTFEEASRLSQEIAFDALRRLSRHARRGRLTAALGNLASLGPLTLCFAPYLAAFHTQHRDARLLRRVAERFAGPTWLRPEPGPRLWFTDTLADTNGVASTVRAVATLAQRRGVSLQVIASAHQPAVAGFDLRNFRPVGEIDCPEYPGQSIAFPPFLEIVEHCERQRAAEVILSTPGPVGLVGLLGAKLLGARVTAVYHTDFPRYVRVLTESDMMGELATTYMRWFYGQADAILVPSRTYLDELVTHGIARERLGLFPHGVDHDLFNPERRQAGFWRDRGIEGEVVLYVGRLSKEKDLEVLFAAADRLRATRLVTLAVVGDGPLLASCMVSAPGHVRFTGYLRDEELAAAYASADVFAFPSATDTFGRAVLEALACGLPAVVTDRGGPREIVERHGAGLVVPAASPAAMAEALHLLLDDRERYGAARVAALATAREHRLEATLETLCPGSLRRAQEFGWEAGAAAVEVPAWR